MMFTLDETIKRDAQKLHDHRIVTIRRRLAQMTQLANYDPSPKSLRLLRIYADDLSKMVEEAGSASSLAQDVIDERNRGE